MVAGTGERIDGLVAMTARGAVLGAVPAVVFFAHFFYGATLDLPALTLFSATSAMLAAALLAPSGRRDLARLQPLLPVALLFLAVLAVAAWTLTSAVPGGPNPLWEYAGLPPAATLNKSATIIEIAKLMGLGTVFALGCLLGARIDRARDVLHIILVLGGLYAIVSLSLFLTGNQIAHGGNRLAGGFYSANVAGTQFGVLTILAMALASRQWSRARTGDAVTRLTDLAPLLAAFLLFVACLLLTASRAAILSTAVAMALFVAWAAFDQRQSRWPLWIMGVVLILAVAVFLVQGNTLFADRLGRFGLGDTIRAAVAQAHWQAFLDSPLLGYGLGTYPQVNDQIMTGANAAELSVSIIQHNAYLQWLEEAGLIGALPMFALLAVILGVTAWRGARRRRGRVLTMGILAASVVVLLHASVDVSLNTPSFEAFWAMLLGLGFALSQASSR